MFTRGKHIPVTILDSNIDEVRNLILQWGKAHYKAYPWRVPDQAWHGLIAEILLQRTKAKNVVPVYEQFISRFKTVEELAHTSVEAIEDVIYPLGLRWRAPLIKKLAESLLQLDGEVPRSYSELLKLPGVGTYVASAWFGFHGHGRSVIIDTNVVRWICRLVDQPMNGETRRKKWLIQLAEKLTPEDNCKEYNYAVLDFSMDICTSVPKCYRCPLSEQYCLYRIKHISQSFT